MSYGVRTGAGSAALGRGGRYEFVDSGVPGAATGEDLCRRAAAEDAERAWAYIWRRLSSLGRNLSGVWYTLGADEGGLKINEGAEEDGV